jgi:4-hydroxybenzoate polyprenyltransferase
MKVFLSSNETFHGLLKIFGNLIIAAFMLRFALVSYQNGNTLLAVLVGIVAFVVFVIAAGYLVICIVGRMADSSNSVSENPEYKDQEPVRHKHHQIKQSVLAIFAVVAVGSITSVSAWKFAGLVVSHSHLT